MSIEAIGLDVEGVGTAREAVALLSLRCYELVLVDVDLPDADGFRCVRQIRRARPSAGVPVIVLTARSSVVDMARAVIAGCDGYLVKPASQRMLRASVMRCIRPCPNASDHELAIGLEGPI